MNRIFCIGILIICFSFSGINAGLAAEIVGVPPIAVQPYNLQGLNQQILERDRQNRDEEIAITGLIDENDKLIQSTLARQQDEALAKVNEIMLDYRNALVSRDRERIVVNSQRPSRYDELIALTEDVEAMKGVHQDLESKSNLIEQKYQMLGDLKDEMIVLNEKLKDAAAPQKDELNKKDAVIEGLKKIAQQQQDKIQMLVSRLGDMDQKISHFDEMLAEKDLQILQLKDSLARARSQSASKDESVRWSKEVLAATKAEAEFFKLSSEQDQKLIDQLTGEVQKIKGDFALRFKDFDQYESKMASLREQVDLLKEELENKITEIKANNKEAGAVNRMQAVDWQDQAEALKSELAQKQQQVDSLKEQLEEKIANQKDEGRLESQTQDLKAQLKDSQDQVTKLKMLIAGSAGAQANTGSLKEQLAAQEDKIVLLKKELGNKTAESDKLTLLVDDYQKKLEAKNNAYNEQLQLVLASQKYQAEKDLNLSIMQQMLDEKTKEVAELTKKLGVAEKGLNSKAHENNDAVREKLTQAIDKIQEQGRMINVLSQKLEEARDQSAALPQNQNTGKP